ncbi:hypothetical protein Aperf_G00000081640 [Anoplocephala perfoliata]
MRRNVSSDIEVAANESDFKFGSLFTELLAIYGYSMVAFVPAVILLCIPASYMQWTLIVAACIISLIVLTSATWSTFKQRRNQLALGLLVLIVIAHVIMAISLSLIFFHQPMPATQAVPPFQFPQQPAAEKPQNNDPSGQGQIQQPKEVKLAQGESVVDSGGNKKPEPKAVEQSGGESKGSADQEPPKNPELNAKAGEQNDDGAKNPVNQKH